TPMSKAKSGTMTTPPPSPVKAPRKPATKAPVHTSRVNPSTLNGAPSSHQGSDRCGDGNCMGLLKDVPYQQALVSLCLRFGAVADAWSIRNCLWGHGRTGISRDVEISGNLRMVIGGVHRHARAASPLVAAIKFGRPVNARRV